MKKKQPKPNAYQRQLAAEWERIVKASAKPLERGAVSKGVTAPRKKQVKLTAAPSAVHVDEKRDLKRFPSRDTGLVAPSVQKTMHYTGTKMLGIGQMHKSSAVPVFSEDEATDLAHMRR